MTHRPPMTPTVCQTCGSVMQTYYPHRKPHICRRCREDHLCYLPTAEEIAAACERIQAKWSESERESHCVTKCEPVELPIWNTPAGGKR